MQSMMSLPTFCLSIKGDTVYLTTKKIASRIVESLSDKSINFRLSYKEVDIIDGVEDELGHENFIDDFQVYPIYTESGRYINKVEFYQILGINKFLDIFNKSFLEKWNLVIFVRNPKKRILSGYIEIVDSIINTYINHDSHTIAKSIIIDYLNLPINSKFFNLIISNKEFSFKQLNDDVVFKILNKSVYSIGSFIYNDEHTSQWMSIVEKLVYNIESKINFIDIDNKFQMKEFEFYESTSNKNLYQKWIDEPNNKDFVDKFFNIVNPLIVGEVESYNYLIKKIE